MTLYNKVFGLLSLEPSERVFGDTYIDIVGYEHGRLVDDFVGGF